MKFTILILALLGIVAADVSHLKNMYLPPLPGRLADKQRTSYVQKTEEIPPSSVQEVTDNSVNENISAQEEAQIASGRLIVEPFKGFVPDNIQNAGVVADIAHQVQAYAQQAVAADTEAEKPVASGPQIQQSSHQQTAYYTPVSQQLQETVPQQEPQQQYNVKEYVKPEQKYYAAPVENHSAVSATASQEIAQQQQAGYYSQQSTAVDSTASAGVDTQYAANGGYVY